MIAREKGAAGVSASHSGALTPGRKQKGGGKSRTTDRAAVLAQEQGGGAAADGGETVKDAVPAIAEEALAAGPGRIGGKAPLLKRITETGSKLFFLCCAVFSVLAILLIFLYLLVASIPAFREVGVIRFLFGTTWNPTDTSLAPSERFGILPMILGTLYVTAGALLLGGAVGVFTAVFIAYYCPKRAKAVVKQVVNLLAGLPSVVYGFFGMVVLVPFLREIGGPGSDGYGVAACVLVLSIMILPTVVGLSVNALEAVPSSCYEGALALGATHTQAVFKAVLPAAKSGVLTGLILGAGRALGETMAVLMVCGGVANMPELFSSMRTLTANVVMEMAYARGLHRETLIATAFVLFVFVALLTLSITVFKERRKNK